MIDIQSVELKTEGVLIRGDPRNGKSLLGVDLCIDGRDRTRIYANLDIFSKKTGKRVGVKLNDMRDLSKIRLSLLP